ncbi:MAG: hypothetical protein JXB49_10320, partial [Bacteroidales bacterium]|nr:hypothetical protein [Bacteroidales bacterium]
YFYETEKRFKVTIHKPDSTENEPRIIAEVSVSKRKKTDVRRNVYYYTYRGSEDGSNYQINLKNDKLQHFCIGKVDEGAVTITAEFDGVPFFQVFWCEKINKNEEFRTFDDL